MLRQAIRHLHAIKIIEYHCQRLVCKMHAMQIGSLRSADMQNDEDAAEEFRQLASSADIVLVEGIQNSAMAKLVAEWTSSVPTFVAFESSVQLESSARLGGLPMHNPG
jgi:hypothetical protein